MESSSAEARDMETESPKVSDAEAEHPPSDVEPGNGKTEVLLEKRSQIDGLICCFEGN